METPAITHWLDPVWWSSTAPAAPGSRLPTTAELPGWVWFQSSGSTAAPKWIGHSREALLLSAATVNRHLDVRSSEVWGLALPIHHVGGFGVIARSFESSARIAVFPGKWQAQHFTEWLAAEHVTHGSLVPTQVRDLIERQLTAPACVRSIVVGGGCLELATGQAARDLGWPILASYGLTEAGSQVATQGYEALEQAYRIDNLPILPHWDLSIGEQQRITLRGDSLYRGMLVAEQGEWKLQRRRDDFLVTSDRGQLEGNRLTILGRIDHMVKILGELVDVDAVEAQLDGGLLVVPIPEARRGHQLILVGECSAEELELRCDVYNREVAGPWRIAAVFSLTPIPLTPLGKPDRQQIARLISTRFA